MYEALAQAVLLEEDARVVREVERVRARHPRASGVELARRVEARAAWRCAAVAAVSSAGEPILGPRLAATADLSFQALSLSRLALAIAHARGRPTTILERGLAVGSGLALAGVSAAVRRGAGRAVDGALSRRAPQLVPILAAFAGAAAGYATARLLGRLAEEYLSNAPRRRW